MTKKFVVTTIVLYALIIPLFGFAQNQAYDWLRGIIDRLLSFIWPVFFGIVVIMFIWTGFLFMSAQGEPAKLQTARKAAIWAVIGIAIALMGYSAVATIKSIIPPYS